MKIPIFPLNGAIMFPKTNLPLNIFEERYIDMIDYAFSNKRLIGMVQQKPDKSLFDIGCYGKITFFNETPDKRYTINLEGLSRFKIISEIDSGYNFRICKIDIVNNFKHQNLDIGLKQNIIQCFKKYNEIKK